MNTDKNTVVIRNSKGQFIKGNKEGNSPGRPKKESCIPDILSRLTNELIEVDGIEIPKRDLILMGVVDNAIKGDQWSIQFIADRTEGKPIQPTADVSEEWKKLFEECGFETT